MNKKVQIAITSVISELKSDYVNYQMLYKKFYNKTDDFVEKIHKAEIRAIEKVLEKIGDIC